jgi:hypothetical protein
MTALQKDRGLGRTLTYQARVILGGKPSHGHGLIFENLKGFFKIDATDFVRRPVLLLTIDAAVVDALTLAALAVRSRLAASGRVAGEPVGVGSHNVRRWAVRHNAVLLPRENEFHNQARIQTCAATQLFILYDHNTGVSVTKTTMVQATEFCGGHGVIFVLHER